MVKPRWSYKCCPLHELHSWHVLLYSWGDIGSCLHGLRGRDILIIQWGIVQRSMSQMPARHVVQRGWSTRPKGM